MSTDAHARAPGGSARPELDAAAPTHAERARTLVEGLSTATLCTLAREPAGHPYGSLITYGLDGSVPVFLVSELAEHTKNLREDSRASLLVTESRPGDPLANGRVTLLGECRPASAEHRQQVRAAYLARHPGAEGYADFADFGLWTLEVSSVRYIGGYGRMSWVTAEAWRSAVPDPIAPHAAAILEHMNQDHADALPLYVRAFTALSDPVKAEMSHIDRLGFEMSVSATGGVQSVRLAFRQPITDKADARQALVALLKEARAKLAGSA